MLHSRVSRQLTCLHSGTRPHSFFQCCNLHARFSRFLTTNSNDLQALQEEGKKERTLAGIRYSSQAFAVMN